MKKFSVIAYMLSLTFLLIGGMILDHRSSEQNSVVIIEEVQAEEMQMTTAENFGDGCSGDPNKLVWPYHGQLDRDFQITTNYLHPRVGSAVWSGIDVARIIANDPSLDVLSPIDGVVVGKGQEGNLNDDGGNSFVWIKNYRFEVKLYHGIYNVSIGDCVKAGQVVGTDSGIGYTTSRGVLCKTTNCGVHAHWAIKEYGQFVRAQDIITHDGVNPIPGRS